MKRRLYTPGPTPIPPEAVLAMAQPIEYHRSQEFRALVRRVRENLRYVWCTESEVAILAASGTGAMEFAIVNLFSPGDTVAGIRGGKFGERWGDIATAYGLAYVPIDVEWGTSPDAEEVASVLDAHPGAKALLTTLCETSTGALQDICAYSDVTQERGTLLVVDAVSALGADEIRMDAWGVDALVSCSQKGLMTPPGLAFCALSERARQASERSTLPKHYFSYAKALKNQAKDETPFTPAISLLYGLDAALTAMREEGIENVWARHARLAHATRAGAKALGLPLFAAHPANALTSIRLPDDCDGAALVRHIRNAHGAIFAGGQEHLAGRIVRIAHLGWMDNYDVLTALGALECGMRDVGMDIRLGAGVAAVLEALSQPPV